MLKILNKKMVAKLIVHAIKDKIIWNETYDLLLTTYSNCPTCIYKRRNNPLKPCM